MKFPGIIISAPKSGSGKTLVTISLLKALNQKKMKVSAFKCGPDYIDPMFHKKIIGVESENLDPFFCSGSLLEDIYSDPETGERDISVVEGVMGLYDGYEINSDKGSTYSIGETLGLPVVLVIDAKGMARSVLAEIAGFVSFDRSRLIKGVILNNSSGKVFSVLKPLIEGQFNVKALGFIPRLKDCNFESRHLGLKMPDEIEGIKEKVSAAASSLEETVNIDELVRLADSKDFDLSSRTVRSIDSKPSVNIAVAYDPAFCFYYKRNLKLLEKAGARLVYFSPLNDRTIPSDVQGIILGGGYPELYAEELSANESMKESIRLAFADSIPLLAECGGFMYLHESIVDEDGKCFKMCGVLKGKCTYTGKLVRFGYVNAVEKSSDYFGTKAGGIKGHEFHYYDSSSNGNDCICTKANGSVSWESSVIDEFRWMGFPHLYYGSNPGFADSFVKKCIMYGEKNGNNR